jgi:hypothetical protein
MGSLGFYTYSHIQDDINWQKKKSVEQLEEAATGDQLHLIPGVLAGGVALP